VKGRHLDLNIYSQFKQDDREESKSAKAIDTVLNISLNRLQRFIYENTFENVNFFMKFPYSIFCNYITPPPLLAFHPVSFHLASKQKTRIKVSLNIFLT